MTSQEPYIALVAALEQTLPELEHFANKAKNLPARKRLAEHLEHLRDALDRVKQIQPRQ